MKNYSDFLPRQHPWSGELPLCQHLDNDGHSCENVGV